MQEKEKKNEEKKNGKLYIVSTPIGNDEDITQRALRALKSCDLVVCEEAKIGARVLKRYNINKDIDLLNEQNEHEKTQEHIANLLKGMTIALISDCGTPIFADPGLELVQRAIRNNIEIIAVPGVSSLMTALVMSGLPIDKFVYGGFLSRDKEERFAQLKRLRDEVRTVAIMDTPYRLMPLLEAASKLMPGRKAYIGCNLTMPFETHHYGTFQQLYEKFNELKFKGEFVIVFAGDTYRLDDEGKVSTDDYRKKFNDKAPYGKSRDYNKTNYGERSDGDRPERRRFDRDRPERRRSDGDRPERRRFDRDRPERRRSDDDRPERRRSDDDRPERRRFDRDRPERRRSDGDRPERRRFDRDKPERRRSDGDRPERRRFDRDKPERRSSDGDRPERRRFDRDKPERRSSDGDRPERSFSDKNRTFKKRSDRTSEK